MAEVHVKGLKALNDLLQSLPVKIEKNVLRGALRAGMNTVKPVAQSNVHNVSGLLAKGLKVGTRARGGTVTANLKATGPHGYIAKFVEFGTRAHEIKPRRAKSLYVAGHFGMSVQHPGARPKPFMRPALDATASAAVVAAGEYMKKRLATKEGLDTAHITVEGDE